MTVLFEYEIEMNSSLQMWNGYRLDFCLGKHKLAAKRWLQSAGVCW